MPLDLPHLPGIAGDVQFSATTEEPIAPSVVTSPSVQPLEMLPEVVAELPDLQLEMEERLPDIPDAAVKTVVVNLPTPVNAPPLPPPPPPPPPPAPLVATEVSNKNKR